jgi:predicted DNA-binding WGR domain protein
MRDPSLGAVGWDSRGERLEMTTYTEYGNIVSNKFWEIERLSRPPPGDPRRYSGEGAHGRGVFLLQTRWGRIGTKGQERIKEYDSLRQLHSAAIKALNSKLRKGYRTVSSMFGFFSRTDIPPAKKETPPPPKPTSVFDLLGEF